MIPFKLTSGVASLQWARVQGLQNGLLLSTQGSSAPPLPTAMGPRTLHALTLYCYDTDMEHPEFKPIWNAIYCTNNSYLSSPLFRSLPPSLPVNRLQFEGQLLCLYLAPSCWGTSRKDVLGRVAKTTQIKPSAMTSCTWMYRITSM